MLKGFRLLIVVVAVALGLIAQGMLAPTMAANTPGAVQCECHSLHCTGSASGSDHHLGMQHCQIPCISGSILPSRSLAVTSLRWSAQMFPPGLSGLPPGRSLAPDPFPPRPRTLA